MESMQDDPAKVGFAIRPAEFYVVPGHVLAVVYEHLLARRASVIQCLAEVPPVHIQVIDNYLALYANLNDAILALITSTPLLSVIEKIKRGELAKRSPKKCDTINASSSINDILKQLNIGNVGMRDEMHPPKDIPPTIE